MATIILGHRRSPPTSFNRGTADFQDAQLRLGYAPRRDSVGPGHVDAGVSHFLLLEIILFYFQSKTIFQYYRINANRNVYEKLKEKYIYDPRICEHSTDNPLSQTEEVFFFSSYDICNIIHITIIPNRVLE